MPAHALPLDPAHPLDPSAVGVLDRPGPAVAGPPVVLLHGWTGSKEDFSAVVDALSADRRVLVPDLPGHGDTPAIGGESAQAIGRVAAWVLAWLDAVGVGDVHVVGHSLGGLLAQRVAFLAAHRVTSLGLIGTGLGAPGEATVDRAVRVATTAREDGMSAAWRTVTGGVDRVEDDPRGDFVRNRFLSLAPATLIGGARALISAAPLGAFLRGIDVPVLVCHGDGDDSWLPHEQRLLARTIRDAQYVVIPDALHSPAVENPQGLLDVLQPFLAAADDR